MPRSRQGCMRPKPRKEFPGRPWLEENRREIKDGLFPSLRKLLAAFCRQDEQLILVGPQLSCFEHRKSRSPEPLGPVQTGTGVTPPGGSCPGRRRSALTPSYAVKDASQVYKDQGVSNATQWGLPHGTRGRDSRCRKRCPLCFRLCDIRDGGPNHRHSGHFWVG